MNVHNYATVRIYLRFFCACISVCSYLYARVYRPMFVSKHAFISVFACVACQADMLEYHHVKQVLERGCVKCTH